MLIVDVLVPFATIEEGEGVSVVVAALGVPVVKVTTALSEIDTVLSVPVMVVTPAFVLDVSVAVYVPFPLSDTVPNEPDVVERTITAPPVTRLLPLASFI